MKKLNYSFIIPHKNCPDYLQRCVDSIPERDDVQVIVVDDNSDEGKKPSLKERENLQVILLDTSQSKGAGRARNVGLEHAMGKWLLFADADDYYAEGFMSVLDRYKELDIDVLYFNFEYRDGITLRLLSKLPFGRFFDEYDGSDIMKEQIKYLHNVPWTKMIKRDMVLHNGLFFEEVPNGNDIYFSMSVGYHARNIAVEKQPLYFYLKNENSITLSKKTGAAHLCQIIHVVKKNELYEYLGHKEWKVSVFKIIIIHIWDFGIMLLFIIIKNLPLILRSKKEWVFSICR